MLFVSCSVQYFGDLIWTQIVDFFHTFASESCLLCHHRFFLLLLPQRLTISTFLLSCSCCFRQRPAAQLQDSLYVVEKTAAVDN